jgi:APA family basic amino acid/polyamine antiporter
MSDLSKVLTFTDIYLLSIGYIIGAGIFVLIGDVSKYAKSLSWLTFVIAGIFALIVSTTYIDVNTIYDTNHGDYTFVQNTLGEIPALITVLLLIGIGIATNSAVALSIGKFISPIVSLSPIAVSVLIILLFTGINCMGVKETTYFNHLCTFTELIGLVIVCIMGMFFHKSKYPYHTSKDVTVPDILYSSVLAIFVYSGFESTVKLSEEAKDVKDIPKAILASVVTATIIYVIVAIAVVKCCNTKILHESPLPIVTMAKMFFGSSISKIFYLIAMLSISNTLVISILGTSRILYSISREYSVLNIFNQVDKTYKTPIHAIIAVAVASIAMLVFKEVEVLASITSYLMFFVFSILNICLIKVYTNPEIQEKLKNNWTYKINHGLPILPSIGLFINLALILFGVYHHLV